MTNWPPSEVGDLGIYRLLPIRNCRAGRIWVRSRRAGPDKSVEQRPAASIIHAQYVPEFGRHATACMLVRISNVRPRPVPPWMLCLGNRQPDGRVENPGGRAPPSSAGEGLLLCRNVGFSDGHPPDCMRWALQLSVAAPLKSLPSDTCAPSLLLCMVDWWYFLGALAPLTERRCMHATAYALRPPVPPDEWDRWRYASRTAAEYVSWRHLHRHYPYQARVVSALSIENACPSCIAASAGPALDHRWGPRWGWGLDGREVAQQASRESTVGFCALSIIDGQLAGRGEREVRLQVEEQSAAIVLVELGS